MSIKNIVNHKQIYQIIASFFADRLGLITRDSRINIGPTQLPGRLFSPSDKSKKLSHHFLLNFPIGMGSYDHHAKYQGVFMDLK